MTTSDLLALLQRDDVRIGALLLGTLIGFLIARRLRTFVKSERPDETLSNLGMVVGLGWSSEAVWTLTGPGGADLPTPIRVALFAVLEIILIVFMIRAKRNQRTLGHPGRSGRNAWIMAAGMSLVAVWTAHNVGEGFLRLLIPLALTGMWWDGLIGEGAKKAAWATSWRWTPRRLLLWLGAIEPGERDVETVHRERLTQQMTNLEFRRRHGAKRRQERAARRLARLSLTADDEVIAEVRQRVDRATWFKPMRPTDGAGASPRSMPAAEAASARVRKVRHGRTLRQVMVTHPRPVIIAAQEAPEDPRATHEIDDAICVMKTGDPALSQRRIAHLLRTSDAKVARALRRKQNPSPPPPVNGKRPELKGADR
jgi:hypothetical protein